MIRLVINKKDYKPIQQLGDNLIKLMWGKSDVVDRTYKKDVKGDLLFDENGNRIVVSENQTEYCLCCHAILKLPKSMNNIMLIVEKGKDYGYDEPLMNEWKEWADFFIEEHLRLNFLKDRLHAKIMDYDGGLYEEYGDKAVNDFTINGEHLWLDKNTRTGLDGRFAAEIAAGKTETTLWANGKSYTLSLSGENSALNMKIALELYASECYDNTQRHVAAKDEMTSIDEVISYDWTTGYPEKLAF